MVGRNDKCNCGSGLKYKKCCLLKQIEKENDRLLNPPPKTQAYVEGKIRKKSPSLTMATLLGIIAASQNNDVFRNLR